MYCHIIRTAYALCLGKPICNSICNGDKCCFDILVGVGFFRGGRVAMLTEVTNEINKMYIILEPYKEISVKYFIETLQSNFIIYTSKWTFHWKSSTHVSSKCRLLDIAYFRMECCSGWICAGSKWQVCCLKIFSMWKILIQMERNLTEVSKHLRTLNTSRCIYLWQSWSVLPLDLICVDT